MSSERLCKRQKTMEEDDQSVTINDQPVTNSDQPVTNSDQPVTNTDQSVTNSDQPVTNTDQSVTNSDQPVTNSDQPVTNSDQPVTNSDQPVTNSDQPVTNSDQPVTNSDQSVTNSDQPVSKDVKPIEESQIEGRCKFYIKKKKRYCKTEACKGQEFCVTHSHEMGVTVSDRKRITCPLDPKHSCYEDQLTKHLRKCNARPGLNPPCYVANINLGDDDGEDPELYKVGIRDVSDEEVLQLVKTVNKLHKEHVGILEDKFWFHGVLQAEADKPSNGVAAQKHIKQQASLIGHMSEAGLLQDNRSYIEFGAGKGGLSHWVQLAVKDCKHNQYILIDKSSVRYKMDTYHRGEDQGPNFERLKINIQDLHLGKVTSLQNDSRPIVAYGKHLCGGATDLMLRCLVETVHGEENSLKCPVSGLVLALCCHHRCDWKTYCGKSFFRKCGLGARDFHLVSSMTSWGTCGTQPVNNETSDHQDVKKPGDEELLDHDKPPQAYNHHRYGNLLPQEREEIGRRCKQLIDRGRLYYLSENGYDTQHVHYVHRDQTLENMALIATNKEMLDS